MRFISLSSFGRLLFLGVAVFSIGFFVFGTYKFIQRTDTANAALSYQQDWCRDDTIDNAAVQTFSLFPANRAACAGTITRLTVEEVANGAIHTIISGSTNAVATVQDFTNPGQEINLATDRVIIRGTTTFTNNCVNRYGLGVSNARVWPYGPAQGLLNFQSGLIRDSQTSNRITWHTPELDLSGEAGTTIPMKASTIIGHMNHTSGPNAGMTRGSCDVAIAEWRVNVPIVPGCAPTQGTDCGSATNICGVKGKIQCNGTCGPPPADSTCANPPVGNQNDPTCLAGIWGWTFDPDTAAPVSVHVYKKDGTAPPPNGSNVAVLLANLPRADVQAQHPSRPATGFQMNIPASWKDGLPHFITVAAINVDSTNTPSGINPILLGTSGTYTSFTCSSSPTGTFTASCAGGARVTASDPSSPGTPVMVDISNGLRGAPGSISLGSGPTVGGTFSAAIPPPTDGNNKIYNLYAYAKTSSGITYDPIPLPQTVTTLTCSPPPPTVTISDNGVPVSGTINVPYNSSHVITWNSPTGLTCTGSASGGASGTIFTGQLTAPTTTYTMTCTNDGGSSVAATVTITVTAPPPPSGTITAVADTDYCTTGAGMKIDWQYIQTSLPISAYQIDIQGTAISSGKVLTTATFGTYTTQGTLAFNTPYTIVLTVWDTADQPNAGLITRSYSTKNGPWVKPIISIAPPAPSAGQVVTFTDTSVYPSDTTWIWDFGDGTIQSTAVNPTTYTYADEQTGRIITLQSTSGIMPVGRYCSADAMSLDIAKPIPGYREVRPGS